jgi:hypothetical protein
MLKMSDHFKDMNEVKYYLENTIKPRCKTIEEYKAFATILGFGEPEGIMTHLEGIGEVDISFADLIKLLIDEGYQTLSSCSGLIKDHPSWTHEKNRVGFIAVLDDEDWFKKQLFKEIGERLDLEYSEGECYLKSSYSLYQKIKGDDETVQGKWNELQGFIEAIASDKADKDL